MRSAAPTRTRSRSTRYCASEPMVNCWVMRHGIVRRVDEEEVDRRRPRPRCGPGRPAGSPPWRRRRGASLPRGRSRPRRAPPAPARRVGTKPWSGSSHAGVSTASPLTIAGSHSRRSSSEPALASAPPQRTALTKWGRVRARGRTPRRGRRLRGRSSPEPPYSSGRRRPIRSRWASCFHSSGG